MTTPEHFSGLVINMLLLDLSYLIVFRHSLCIRKSLMSTGAPQ